MTNPPANETFFARSCRRVKDWENGFERRLKEHFTVLVAREGHKPVAITAPRGSYYADPFLVSREGRTFLFVEQLHYRDCLGRRAVVALDENLNASAPQDILDLDYHASFPFIFEHDGKAYLLPETSNGGTIDLYVCETFPARWKLARRLFSGVDAADSILFFQDGLWWLVTALREGDGRHLAIFFTDDFLTGEWRPHPVNAKRLYIDRPNSSGRNAGGVFRKDGALYRVAQENLRYYGEDIRVLRIDTLTTTHFVETSVPAPEGLPAVAASFSPHHLSINEGLAAWDVRDRTGWFTTRRIGNP